MKIQSLRHRSRGVTLLELTVIILVLLSLVTILFVGARAWKRGSERTACLMNIRMAQQATRSLQNLCDLPEGATLDMAEDLIGSGNFIEIEPICPGGGTYEFAKQFPPIGVPALACSLAAAADHQPPSSVGW
ncbi:hypothetical protein HAHE_05450 [Haloferula helveola]|uniref:Prepilin-type N-terminal cleavage/methylation domain-containing protein n=1 Tax=Haloferula helveola TaxID=490095 RepID=A0ABM7RD56_9BACT|nr:hypothetical protein HAHE_05450 [Haloferula helveola]